MPQRIALPASTFARYGIAAAVVLGCVGLDSLFRAVTHPPYLPLFAAIVLSGVLFDRWTGVFATVLGAAIASFFFVDPIGSLDIDSLSDVLGMASFLATGLLAALTLEVLHGALRRARG
jgi:K+-sensing histidine kinase KdpD